MGEIVTYKPHDISSMEFIKLRMNQTAGPFRWTVLETFTDADVIYAAVERVDSTTHEIRVMGYVVTYAAVNNAGGKANFRYNIIEEKNKPFAINCPDSILDRLSDTDNLNAVIWRTACRTHNQERTLKQQRVADLKNGDHLQFSPPINVKEHGAFTDLILIDCDRWIFAVEGEQLRVQLTQEQLLEWTFMLVPSDPINS